MSGFPSWKWSWWGVVLGIVVLVGNSWAQLTIHNTISMTESVSEQLPTRTIPHHTGINPDDWLFLVGSGPGWELS